jgi:AcrR family transcriptional regulator
MEKISGYFDYRRLPPVAFFFGGPAGPKMTQKRSLPLKLPKLRAHARRNRERILEVAREAFTPSGADDSLDDIAKQAGIGPGTLYRP